MYPAKPDFLAFAVEQVPFQGCLPAGILQRDPVTVTSIVPDRHPLYQNFKEPVLRTRTSMNQPCYEEKER